MKASEQGNKYAQHSLGIIKLLSKDFKKKEAEAKDLLAKLAVKELPKAKPGEVVVTGIDTFQTLRKLAEERVLNELNIVGDMYAPDSLVESHNEPEAVELFRRAAEQGLAAAQYAFAIMLFHGKGTPENKAGAQVWFQKAADQALAIAENTLGNMFMFGFGIPKNEAEGVNWYRKAAKQGYREAQYNMARARYEGFGIPKSEAIAADWAKMASEQGHSAAQCLLGTILSKGIGITRNPADAVLWLRKSAAQESIDAQYLLGSILEMGNGVPKNEAEARNWYIRAIANNYQIRMKMIYKSLSPEKSKSHSEAIKYVRDFVIARKEGHEAKVAKEHAGVALKINTEPFKKVNALDLVEDGFLVSKKTLTEVIRIKKSNPPHVVKIPRKDAVRLGVPELKFSVLFDDQGVPYALYRGKEKLLGKGGMASIKIVQNAITGEWLAVKIMLITAPLFKAIYVQEGEMLTAFGRLRGKVMRSKKGYLFQDIIPGSKLFSHINTAPEKDLGNPVILKEWLEMAESAAKELRDLHKSNIIHRDIKPENYIYIPGVGAFLIDFGLGQKLEGEFYRTDINSGTLGYMAPELFIIEDGQVKYSKKSDVYALGATFKTSLEKVTTAIQKSGSATGEVHAILHDLKHKVVNPMLTLSWDRISSDICLEKIEGLHKRFPSHHYPKAKV